MKKFIQNFHYLSGTVYNGTEITVESPITACINNNFIYHTLINTEAISNNITDKINTEIVSTVFEDIQIDSSKLQTENLLNFIENPSYSLEIKDNSLPNGLTLTVNKKDGFLEDPYYVFFSYDIILNRICFKHM